MTVSRHVEQEARADIQTYDNESVHENLPALAGRMGLRKFPSTP